MATILKTTTVEYISTGDYTISNSKVGLAIMYTSNGSWEFIDDFSKISTTSIENLEKLYLLD